MSDQVDELISELRATRAGLAHLEDEVKRLADLFARMLEVEPPKQPDVSPFAAAAGGLLESLVTGKKRRAK